MLGTYDQSRLITESFLIGTAQAQNIVYSLLKHKNSHTNKYKIITDDLIKYYNKLYLSTKSNKIPKTTFLFLTFNRAASQPVLALMTSYSRDKSLRNDAIVESRLNCAIPSRRSLSPRPRRLPQIFYQNVLQIQWVYTKTSGSFANLRLQPSGMCALSVSKRLIQ